MFSAAPCAPKRGLRNQRELSCGLARFQVAVRLLRVLQLVYMLDAQFKLALDDHFEHLSRAPLQFLARRSVMKQGGTRQKKRPFLGKFDRIKWRNGAAGAAEEHHISARAHDV